MNYIKQLEKDFVPMATPNPEELSFKVSVNYRLISPSDVPSLGSTYSAWSGKNPIRETDWGTYLFTGVENSDSLLWFNFAKPKTAEETKTPFRTSTKFQEKEWDNILLALNLVKDTGMTRTSTAFTGNRKITLSGPRYSLRPVVIPGGMRGTQFVKREFLSPTQFNIPQHETPIPLLVAYDVDGFEGQISCLHEDLEIKARRTVVSASNGVAPVGVMAGQFFPATNFTTWEDHFISYEQNFVNAVWHRVQVEVIAPDLDEPVSLNR